MPDAILEPSSLPVVVAQPDKRLQTGPVLEWYDRMTDAKHNGSMGVGNEGQGTTDPSGFSNMVQI